MKQALPYHICNPPKASRKAKLDTIALVHASLLYQKGKYQTIANTLSGEGMFICQAHKKERITALLEHVAVFFRQRGRFGRVLPAH
jgi:hypothetical protein